MNKNTVLTTQELSVYLKLNEKTVLKMAQTRELPGFKIGNQWRFYLSTIDEYLQDKIIKSPEYDFGRLIRTTNIMPLSRLIEPSFIELNLKTNDHSQILYLLSQLAYKRGIAVSTMQLFDQLTKREKTLSTAIGKGIAIPHPRNPSDNLFKAPGIFLARSISGIDFCAPDGQPVNLFFLTCASDVVLHLKFLSKIAELLKHKDIFNKIMNANTKEEVIKILIETERISIGGEKYVESIKT